MTTQTTPKMETVQEYNERQTSFHMTMHTSEGALYKRGYVVTDAEGAVYCKSLAIAEAKLEAAKNNKK